MLAEWPSWPRRQPGGKVPASANPEEGPGQLLFLPLSWSLFLHSSYQCTNPPAVSAPSLSSAIYPHEEASEKDFIWGHTGVLLEEKTSCRASKQGLGLGCLPGLLIFLANFHLYPPHPELLNCSVVQIAPQANKLGSRTDGFSPLIRQLPPGSSKIKWSQQVPQVWPSKAGAWSRSSSASLLLR